MVLGKLPVPGRPTSLNLKKSRTRAYCSCSRCGWGCFYSHLSFLSSFSLSLGDDPIWTEILSQRVVKPKNNQPTKSSSFEPTSSTLKSGSLSDISSWLSISALGGGRVVR